MDNKIFEQIKQFPLTRIMEWLPYGDGITLHFGGLHEIKIIHKRYGEIPITLGEYHIDFPDVFWRVVKNERILFASEWYDDDDESIIENIPETIFLNEIKKIDKNHVQFIFTDEYVIDLFNLHIGNFENEKCFSINDKNDNKILSSNF